MLNTLLTWKCKEASRWTRCDLRLDAFCLDCWFVLNKKKECVFVCVYAREIKSESEKEEEGEAEGEG